MGQIWDFLRSVSLYFGSPSQNVMKTDLDSLRCVPFGASLTTFWLIWPFCGKIWYPRECVLKETIQFYSLMTGQGENNSVWEMYCKQRSKRRWPLVEVKFATSKRSISSYSRSKRFCDVSCEIQEASNEKWKNKISDSPYVLTGYLRLRINFVFTMIIH